MEEQKQPKPFMTYEQLIQKLKEEKKLGISDDDYAIKLFILQYILKIEKHMKSLISYSFCEAYGEEQQHYLNATKYIYTPVNQDAVNELITRLSQITSDPKNYPYIKHQKKQHGNIPLWVMMKACWFKCLTYWQG